MVSEFLEETGIDREHLRQARRQILEGIILLCEWQLRRMNADEPRRPAAGRKGRTIPVE
jgi:hypothetical protein